MVFYFEMNNTFDNATDALLNNTFDNATDALLNTFDNATDALHNATDALLKHYIPSSPTINFIHPHGDEENTHHGIRLAAWRWKEVGSYFVFIGFTVLSGLAKIAFHHLHFISSRIPESCLLIVVGICFGAVLEQVDAREDGTLKNFPEFNDQLFFFFLLPPIILEAAYSLYDRVFLDNLRTILFFAVFGTILNFLMIGGLLNLAFHTGSMGNTPNCTSLGDSVLENASIGIHHNNTSDPGIHHNNTSDSIRLNGADIFLFASLISAVDPVAVLAIFSEVSVNADLYYLVFGESLLNDGVAVVLYNMMNVLAGMEANGIPITYIDYLLGICSFFTVALGGLSVGIFFGFLTGLTTKYTRDVQVVEPLAVFGLAYLSYVSAELFHWSGIISLIGCGLVQAHYTFKNISRNSYTTVKYFIKMLSSTSDSVIFLYLGMAFFQDHCWHYEFTIWTLLLCFVVRFVVVFFLTIIVNRLRQAVKPINLKEQFIMAYGGLRGAVGFSLVMMVDSRTIPAAKFFETTTLAVVMVTVFVQGITIKPLVKRLEIKLADNEQKKLNEEISDTLMEHIMRGVEIVIGKRGHFYYFQMIERFDQRFLMKIFTRCDYRSSFEKLNEEWTLSDHFVSLYGPGLIAGEEARTGIVNPAYDNESGLSEERYIPRRFDGKSSTLPAIPSRDSGYETESSRSHSLTPTTLDPSIRASFRKAMKDVPYYNLHKKYNKNLVNQEDQELETHLRRRRKTIKDISEKVLRKNSQAGIAYNRTLSDPTGEDRRRKDTPPLSKQMETNLNHLPASERGKVSIILRGHMEKRRSKSMKLPGEVGISNGRMRRLSERETDFRDMCAEGVANTFANNTVIMSAILEMDEKKDTITQL